ncbi:prepilin-type N-terminal cleavage/methylation domain-containing protein [Geobacter grbiciae]|uniref:prepilin-type N-terminal cleavage/methylation domain-containing protein n=1 Tax=Geobacter grbiciae TaxID=155042 RepID=UPI001C016DBA|nr:prepilin-type N-terminal cleavage/methylation domain-containing protein [Geobacter grbiciae]MBT1076203.1 prepilin-type N-terminal cleavage/methylation domain-containing protein [Geobacter grbiciae]
MTCVALTAQPRSMRGYTLVEVLVVIVILAVISAGLSTVFITGQKEYGVREATIRMQQQARQAMNEMERELKNTGYGLMDMGDLTIKVYGEKTPSWQVVEALDGGTEPDSIKVLYSGAESDVGYDYIVSVDHPTNSSIMKVSAVGSVPPSRTLNDDFIKGDLFLVYDPSDPGKPATRFQATNVTAPDKIHHNPGGYNPPGGALDVAYGVGSKVLNLRLMQAKSVSYSVDARQNLIKTVEDLSLIDPPANQRTKIVASGVEDLQIRYQFKDGTWKNAGDPGFVAKDLRAIQVSIIVKTEKPDPRYPGQSLQLTGSYGNGGVKNSAGYRRMAMSTIIYVRNLGFRD